MGYQDKYDQQFELLRKEIRDLSAECNRLEHEKQNTRTETDIINQKTSSLEKEKDILENSIKDAIQETAQATKDQEDLTRQIEDLKLEIEKEETRFENEKSILENRLNNHKNENMNENAIRPVSNSAIISQIKEARKEIEAATDQYHEVELNELNNKVKILRDEIFDKEQKQKDLDKDIDDLQNKKYLLESDVRSLEAKIKGLEDSIGNMKDQHDKKICTLEEKLNKEQKLLDDASKDLENIQRQLDTHIRDKDSLTDELAEMKRLLNVDEKEDIDSVLSLSREPSMRSIKSS